MTTTLNKTILSVIRRTSKGFTVGEIYDRVITRFTSRGVFNIAPYNSVRARVYELARDGKLLTTGSRKDPVSLREAKVFVVGTHTV